MLYMFQGKFSLKETSFFGVSKSDIYKADFNPLFLNNQVRTLYE